MKFVRSRTEEKFTVTFYWWIFKLKTFEFTRHYEGSVFMATSTRLDGYYVAEYSYKGHGRKFYLSMHY